MNFQVMNGTLYVDGAPRDVTRTYRTGNDLIVVLASGEEQVMENFFLNSDAAPRIVFSKTNAEVGGDDIDLLADEPREGYNDTMTNLLTESNVGLGLAAGAAVATAVYINNNDDDDNDDAADDQSADGGNDVDVDPLTPTGLNPATPNTGDEDGDDTPADPDAGDEDGDDTPADPDAGDEDGDDTPADPDAGDEDGDDTPADPDAGDEDGDDTPADPDAGDEDGDDTPADPDAGDEDGDETPADPDAGDEDGDDTPATPVTPSGMPLTAIINVSGIDEDGSGTVVVTFNKEVALFDLEGFQTSAGVIDFGSVSTADKRTYSFRVNQVDDFSGEAFITVDLSAFIDQNLERGQGTVTSSAFTVEAPEDETPENPDMDDQGGDETPVDPGAGDEGGDDTPTDPDAGDEGGDDTPADPDAGDEDVDDTPADPDAGDEDGDDTPADPDAGDEGGDDTPTDPDAGDEGGDDTPADPDAGDDNINESLTVSIDVSDLQGNENGLAQVTFSEPVTGLQPGVNIFSDAGTVTSLITFDFQTFFFEIDPNSDFSGDGQITIDLSQVETAEGEFGSGTVTSEPFTFDQIEEGPEGNSDLTVDIDVSEIAENGEGTVTFTFSEAVTNLGDINTVAPTYGFLSDFQTEDGITWTATLTQGDFDIDDTGTILLDLSEIETAEGENGVGVVQSDPYVVNTSADVGDETPADPDAGDETPADPDAGDETPADPDAGDETPADPDAGDETPTDPDAGDETPADPDAGDETPTDPDAGDETPADPDAGDETPADPDAGDETPADPDAGDETPTDPDAGDETPADPDAGDETPADPDAGDETPADPDAGDETPVDPDAGDGVNESLTVDIDVSQIAENGNGIVTFTFSEPVTNLGDINTVAPTYGFLSDFQTEDGITWTATLTQGDFDIDDTGTILLDLSEIETAEGENGVGVVQSDPYVVNTSADVGDEAPADPDAGDETPVDPDAGNPVEGSDQTDPETPPADTGEGEGVTTQPEDILPEDPAAGDETPVDGDPTEPDTGEGITDPASEEPDATEPAPGEEMPVDPDAVDEQAPIDTGVNGEDAPIDPEAGGEPVPGEETPADGNLDAPADQTVPAPGEEMPVDPDAGADPVPGEEGAPVDTGSGDELIADGGGTPAEGGADGEVLPADGQDVADAGDPATDTQNDEVAVDEPTLMDLGDELFAQDGDVSSQEPDGDAFGGGIDPIIIQDMDPADSAVV